MKKYFNLILCNLFWIGMVSGIDFSPSVLVSGETTAHNYYPDIAVDEGGIIYVVWVNSHAGGDVHFALSIDHGLTFTHFSRVNSIENHAITIGFSGPKIDVVNDTIHVIWSDERNGYDHSTVYYARSTDLGITWEESRIGHPNGVNFYPELMVDSQGNLHASFHYFLSGSFAYRHIAHTFSSDGGDSWSDFSIVSDYEGGEPCDCCPIEIHELPNGNIITGFRNNVNDIRDMYSMDWQVEDSTWINLSPMSHDNYYVTYCPSSGPSMVSQDSTVGMAYMAEANGETRVFLSMSHDMGDTFDVKIPMEMTSGSGFYQNHPSAVMTGDGNIHMIWEDSRDNGNILYSVLETGQSFMTGFSTVNDSATASHEIAPKLAKDSENYLYAVWVDRRYGKHIRFSTTYPVELSNLKDGLPTAFTLYEPYPNPFNATTTISFSLERASQISLKIFDLKGRLVEILAEGDLVSGKHKVNWNASQFASGVYFISLQRHGKSKSVKTLYLK